MDPPQLNGREMIETCAARQAGSRAYDVVMDFTRKHNDEVRQRVEDAGHAAANAVWAGRE